MRSCDHVDSLFCPLSRVVSSRAFEDELQHRLIHNVQLNLKVLAGFIDAHATVPHFACGQPAMKGGTASFVRDNSDRAVGHCCVAGIVCDLLSGSASTSVMVRRPQDIVPKKE